MALPPGARLGPYEIVSPLGEGGMGEVYKARDTRLEKGPLPLDQALKIATEIADALDKAHRQGITHRDLKPANIMLTKAGSKLLDFGLAKLRAPAGPISMSGMAKLATSTPFDFAQGKPGTAHGMILGTVQYMAPEQVEGKEADARSDIWALGAVIYEMITGTRAFQGDTPASVIGSILKDEPPLVSTRQPLVPRALDHLVGMCLAKDPDERWQSAADFHRAIDWIGVAAPPSGAAPTRAASVVGRWLPIAVIAALLGAVAVMFPAWSKRVPEGQPHALRLSLLPPSNATFSSPPASVVAPQIAVSPDGERVVFAAETPGGPPMLWIRPLDAGEAQALAGTEDATYPFWRPDSRALGFFSRGKLKTIEIAGGLPKTLSDAPLDSRGGSWAGDGTILFAPNATSVIYRVAATGGPVAPVTHFDESRKENSHRFPSFLPDGRHFLYLVRSERQENWGVSVGSLDGSPTKVVVEGTDWLAQYVAPGFILFLRGSTLMAQAFDVNRMQLTGDALTVAKAVGSTTTAYGAFSASQTGVLMHATQIDLRSELRWFDREGHSTGPVTPVAEYLDFELSRDEHSLAASRLDPQVNTADIYVLDLVRDSESRLTTDRNNDASPLWSPDGSQIVFRTNRGGLTDLYRQRPNGAEAAERLFASGSNLISNDWSLDGRYIVYTDTAVTSGFDIWVWPTSGDLKAQRVVHTQLNAMHGRLSPDSRWLAYASDELGAMQVFVQPFPATGDRKQISTAGGSEPRWRRDGHELYYLASDLKLMSVAVPGGNAFKAETPAPLFETRVPLSKNPYRSNYAASANGQRFLVSTKVPGAAPPTITVTFNWIALLKK